jgi:hypothetical protein
MSEQKISQAMEALKDLSDEDKQFMLGYAAGLTAKQPEKEAAESKGEEAQA